MRGKIELCSRIVLGLIFLVFGSNGLSMIFMGKGFIPMPPPSPEMQPIILSFVATKYLMLTVKLLEVVAGILLLINKFVPFALLLLAPIVYNIIGLHIFVDTSGLPMALALFVLISIQFFYRKEKFVNLMR